MIGEGPTIKSSGSLLSKCLDVFKGILNTLPNHTKGHRLGAVLILHHLGAKVHIIMIRMAFKGFNGVLGNGEKGKKLWKILPCFIFSCFLRGMLNIIFLGIFLHFLSQAFSFFSFF